jgi:predicted Zn-dependent protease
MYSSLKSVIAGLLAVWMCACATPPAPKPLTLKEQIEVDTVRARELTGEFMDRVEFQAWPKAESFFFRIAESLAKEVQEFPVQKLRIRIHLARPPAGEGIYAFPGAMISFPDTWVRQVEYENELAAALAYHIAHLVRRSLAIHVEEQASRPVPVPPILFGTGSVFEFHREERASAIQLAVRMLYRAGYDTRGMASIFQRAPELFGNRDSGSFKKEVDFNIKEAQRSSSELLPAIKPVVRSPEFIRFKKELERVKP